MNSLHIGNSASKPLPSVFPAEQLLPFLERFVAWRNARGRTMTRPRQILAELLATLDGSFDVDSLIERLPVKGAPDYVSRPSIYRTLAELVDCGLLLVSENNGRTIYRLQT